MLLRYLFFLFSFSVLFQPLKSENIEISSPTNPLEHPTEIYAPVRCVQLIETDEDTFEINWEKDPDPSTTYVVIASESSDDESGRQLFFATQQNSISVDKQFPYYQIYALKGEPLPIAPPRGYVRPQQVSQEVWEALTPYFLPEDHPIKTSLDRMFTQSRVTFSTKKFKKAGFPQNKPRSSSGAMISKNPKLPGYFVKAYSDTNLKIINEWKRWLNRITGAEAIREAIEQHSYQDIFKVPNKWIYPLPSEPAPKDKKKYVRKYFILIAEDMNAHTSKKSREIYSKLTDTRILDALFILFRDLGLKDSVNTFNSVFTKDGRIAFIDTEVHHKWPVNYLRLKGCLNPKMAQYWQELINNNGPK